MATTLRSIRTDALLRLGDPDQDVWKTNEEINDYIKEAYDRFIFLTRFLWKSATLADVATTAVTTLPADFLFLDRATWNHGTLIALKSLELAARDETFETRTGEPQAYTLDGDGVLGFRKYPAPSVNGSGDNDTRIEYFYRPADLSSDTTALQIPDVYAKVVRHYVLARALEREGPGQDEKLSQHFMSRFEEGVKRAIERTRRAESRRMPSIGARAVRRRKLSDMEPNIPSVLTGFP